MTDERMSQLARQHGLHDMFARVREDAFAFARAVLAEETGGNLRDQLTAALAERDRLPTERDEARAAEARLRPDLDTEI